jgi:hypothetical protein
MLFAEFGREEFLRDLLAAVFVVCLREDGLTSLRTSGQKLDSVPAE